MGRVFAPKAPWSVHVADAARIKGDVYGAPSSRRRTAADAADLDVPWGKTGPHRAVTSCGRAPVRGALRSVDRSQRNLRGASTMRQVWVGPTDVRSTSRRLRVVPAVRRSGTDKRSCRMARHGVIEMAGGRSRRRACLARELVGDHADSPGRSTGRRRPCTVRLASMGVACPRQVGRRRLRRRGV